MSDQWITELTELLRSVAGRPASDGAVWLVLAAGAVAVLIMMAIMANAMNNNNANLATNLLVLVVGGGAMLASAVAVRLYLFPEEPASTTALAVSAGAAALALMLVAIPLFCLVQRVKFLSAFISLAVSLAVGALALLGARSAYAMIKGGEDASGRIERRTDDVNRMLRGK